MIKAKPFFTVAVGVFVLASCNSNQVNQTELLTTSVRETLNSPTTLPIADEIESVKELTKIAIPQELEKINANENPIFIIYKIKNSINYLK